MVSAKIYFKFFPVSELLYFFNTSPLLLAKVTAVLNKLNENDTLVKRKVIKRAKSVYDKLPAGC